MLLLPGLSHAATGGPDLYGYSWINSNSPSPSIQYNWVDISTTGSTAMTYCDDCSVTIPLNFDFYFYGNKYSQANISSNGYLSFTDYASAYTNFPIPSPALPRNLVSPFWDDLYVGGARRVSYQTIGTAPNRIFVAQWSNVQFYYDPAAILNFEILLYEGSNAIVFQYNTLIGLGASGNSATIGIDNVDGTVGLLYSFNRPVLTPGLAIAFVRQLDVKSVTPANNASNVTLNQNIRASFNQSVDPSSITNSSITVTGSASGALAGQISYLPLLNSLEFSPALDFQPNETITATLGTDIRSVAGATLASAYTWTFTTGVSSDAEAPALVSGLTATDAPNDAGGKIQLAWATSSATDLAYYHIFRSNAPFTTVAGLAPVAVTSQTAYTDNTTDGVSYYYAVTAVDTSGNENTTVQSVGPAVSINNPPAQPTGLYGYTSANGVNLYWNTNNEADLAGYKIYFGTSSGNYGAPVVLGRVTNYELTSLQSCTNYYIAVSAYDTGGVESAYSTQVVVNSGSGGSPTAPTGLRATSSDGTVTITWNQNPECDIYSYYIYRSTTSGTGYQYLATNYGATNTSYQDLTAVNGTTYYYAVIAVDSFNLTSPYSEEISATAINTVPPSRPYNLSSSPSYNGVYIYWYENYTPDVAGYKIYYGTNTGMYTQTVTVPRAGSYYSQSYELTGLTNCINYYLVISAYDLSGNESARSSEISFNSEQAGSPAAPTGLNTLSEESKITLTWNANPECDIQNYYVYRKASTESSYSYQASVTSPSYVDQKIANGVTYSYEVVALDRTGYSSPYSAPASAVAVNTTPPATPTNFNVYSYAGQTYLYLTWSGNSGLPDLSGYKIYYGTSSGNYTQTVTIGNQNYYNLYGLQGCTLYYLTVKAVDLSGNESDFSQERTGTPSGSASLQAPTGVAAEAAESVITISWNANPECDINGYRVYRSTAAGSGYQEIAFVTSGTSYQDKKIANNTVYYYRVKAFNYANVASPDSTTVSAQAIDTTPPLRPSWASASPGDAYIDASWAASASPDLKEYRLYYGTQPGNYTAYITTTAQNYRLSNIPNCTTYYIAVEAVDLSGLVSTFSPEASARTYVAGAPTAPAGLSGVPSGTSAILSWTPNAECDVNAYRIYRSQTSGTGFTYIGVAQTNTFTNSNLGNGATYYYRITAVDTTNLESAPSAEISITTRSISAPGLNPVTSPTNTGAQTLSGTKETNSYVYVNNVKTSSAYADTVWSYSVSLIEGTNSFTIYAKDDAGSSSSSITAAIVKDSTAPRILSSTPASNAFVNGLNTIDIVLKDDTTNVDMLQSLVGADVKMGGAAVSGTWTTGQDNHIIFTPGQPSALADGVYMVTVHPVDTPLANTGTATFSFTLDTAPPTVQSLTMNPTSPHKAEAVLFTIVFSEDMLNTVQPTVTFSHCLLCNTYTIPSGTWTNTKTWQGSYTFTSSTGDGTYTVKIADAKDKAGNTITTQSMTDAFVLDTTPPSAPGLDPVTTPTNNANQIVKGSKETDTAIVINSGIKVALNSNATWSYSYPLSEGTNTLSITARDAAGNDSTPTVAVIILDTTPPTFTINPYQNPSPISTQSLSGDKEPGCSVKLNGTQIFSSLDSSSTWSYTVNLVSGITNHFVFTAADALGNTTTKAIDILYDNAPPAALGPGVLTADGSGKGNEATLSWIAYPETTDVAYYAVYRSSSAFTDVTGMTPIGTTTKGTKTFKATGLTQGSTYYFAVVPVDLAGNQVNMVNAASAVPTDTMAPEEVTNLAATAGYNGADQNFITLTWTPSVNSMKDLADQIVYIDSGSGYDAGTSLGAAVSTYKKTGLVDATKYKSKVTVKDTLGHESQGVIIEAFTRLANPANLTATTASGKATLSWTAVSSSYVKQYNVYRKASTTQQTDISAMTLVKSITGALTYTDTGLTNDTTYQYAVTVLNTSGAERSDVQSISATPRADSTGPVIDTFNIIAGQVVTAPITISATAHDAESSMGSMELSVDGSVVATHTGGSISSFWNVVVVTDGNHTIKLRAVDSLGNATEDSRQVIVSLAPPATPSITGHVVSQTTPTYVVTISGTAPLFTTVTLKVNGVVVSTSQTTGTSGTGTFSFTSIALIEGDNLLAVKASDRGGESAYSPDYKITVDTGAPPAPQNLTSQPLAGGLVRFTWTNSPGEVPTGYNLYVSSSSFGSKNDAGVSKTNTTPITYLLKEYLPADDGLKYYAVTALDSAGNESGLSNIVSVSSDRAGPTVTSIEYHYYDSNNTETYPAVIAGIGGVRVVVTVSEMLKELPFFGLESQDGSPIVLSLAKVNDTRYEGTFAVTDQSPQGATTYKFSGKDMVGNRGNAKGTGISIDVKGPEATIQSPLTTQQIMADPVTVNFVLNEPSVSTPSLALKASDGTTSLATALTSTDNGVHWTGTLNVSAMPEGKTEFILTDAKDGLGNVGTTVSFGRYMLFYKDTVPPPGIPDGLAAKSVMGGAVTITWYPVANPYSDLSTLTYNLYRRAEGETTATKIQTGIGASTSNSTTAQDIPPVDGVYYYSVTSVGLMGSESPASAEVQAISDRTGPPAPQNLSLSLGSGGVTATWDPVTDTTSTQPIKGYNLYRATAAFTTSAGLTPVSKTANAIGVDTSPSKTYRFYAVAAVDYLGNEGPLSASQEIDFPVSPVRNLVLQRIDDAAPTITWQAPEDGSIAGYNIYRNGSPITSYPVPNIFSYTDGYYTSGTTYGVSAVDNLGNESPVKTVTLPAIILSLKDGTTLRRGLLETIPVLISLGSASSVSLDSIDVQVGTAPISSIQGPFVLDANTSFQIEKVAATTADAMSPVSVFIQANWSPSPGVTVKLSRTVAAEVLGSSTSFEIFNDPLVRNTDGKVRLKINNIGSAQMEFVTSENSGVTHKVKVNLKDEDGNILSTGYLDQRVGAAIVNASGYAVARLDPNTSITTDPITVPVPASAPNNVTIEAVIDNTYYHYAKADQVTAPGMKGAAATVIQDTPYRALASPEKSFYPNAQPVVVTGSAISSSSGALVPNVPVKLGISVKGFDRFYTVTTDSTGHFSYTFNPSSNEAGDYSIWAIHPDVKDRTVQATFSIAGLAITPNIANVTMARNRTLDIPVTLQNYGGGSLTGLTFETTASSGISVGVINSGDTTLTAGEKQSVTFRISTDASSPDTASATFTAKTAEGLSVTLNANVTIVNLVPIISTSPTYIDTGMVRGDQKIASFTITNTGQDTLRNARLVGPSTGWMSLTSNTAVGDIAPGASTTVAIMLKPDSTISQGVYDDTVVINADNHIPYTYHIQVTVTSSSVGNALFDVMDQFFERVAGVTITVQNQQLPELLYTLRTDTAGNASLYDIPEGRYVFNITAPSHLPYSGTFTVTAGITTVVPIGMQSNLVTVTWSVTPTTIQDQYQVTVTQTYQTNVPAAVVVTEPPTIQVPALKPGQVFNGEFTITNYGLIAADYKGLDFPKSVGDYDIEVLATIPTRLAAKQKVSVPYRITRRPASTAWNIGEGTAFASNSQLFDEVKGYGYGGVVDNGSPVTITFTTSFSQVICPNTPNQTTITITTTYTITIYPDAAVMTPLSGSGVTGGGGGGGGGGGSATYTYNQYIPSQSSTSTTISGNLIPLTTINCSAGSGGGGGGGSGGSSGGTGGSIGGTGGGTSVTGPCSGTESILVSQSTFTNGISLPGAGNISIASPANWATLNGPKAVIKGAVDDTTQINTVMVQVSSQNSTDSASYLAQVNGKYFAAAVNLYAGANTVKATVTYSNGQQKDATITVTAVNQPQNVQLSATPSAGTMTLKPSGQTTLDVTFHVTTTLAYPVASYTWDFNGDGSIDLTCGSMSNVTASYQQIGLYLATVTVTDTQGNKYSDTVIVNVMDTAQMGNIFHTIWFRMQSALLAGNIGAALTDYSDNAKSRYEALFNQMVSVNTVGTIYAGITEIVISTMDDQLAECWILRQENDGTHAYPVTFVKDENGIWKIMGY